MPQIQGQPRRPNHPMTLRLLSILRLHPDGLSSVDLYRKLYGTEPTRRGASVYDTSAVRGLIREYRAGRILYMQKSPWQIVMTHRVGCMGVYALRPKVQP